VVDKGKAFVAMAFSILVLMLLDEDEIELVLGMLVEIGEFESLV
jgi:hypothetical protein